MDSRVRYEVELREDVVLFHLSGEYNLDGLSCAIREVGKRCEQSGCRCILADAREHVGLISVIELHLIGEMVSREIPRGCSVALVVDPGRLAMDRHLETVAVNRGVPFRLFTDFDDAGLWLKTPSLRADSIPA